MSSSAAAAAVAVNLRNERRNSLGEMPKMPWVWVCDQRTPSQPRKLPVPKYFQSGNEHVGKLTWESMKKWLSRGLERPVTSAWIAVEQPGKSDWHLREVPVQLSSSPFKDGTLVVVCCANESLNPNVSGQLPPREKLRTLLQGQSSSAEASVLGEKMWKSARSRVLATMAFSQPATIFGKKLSGESQVSSASNASATREAARNRSGEAQSKPEVKETAGANVPQSGLKSAIKKNTGETKKVKVGVRTDEGIEGTQPALAKTKPRLKFEGHDEVMDIPAECYDPNEVFNAPVKPWLLYSGPGAPTTMTRATQTDPLKVPVPGGRCCQPCCCDGHEESDIFRVQ